MWKWYGKHIFITDVGKHNWIMNYLTNEIPFVSVGDRWKPIRVSSHKPSQNSLTFPDHFVFSPNQETCYRYYYCLNNNVASNLTNHSPKLPIYEVITIRQNVKNMKFYISNFHKTVHSDKYTNYYGLSNDHRCNSSFIHHLLRPMMSTSFLKKSFRHNGSAVFGKMCRGCPDVNKHRGMNAAILRQDRPFMSIKSFAQHSGWQEMVSLCSLIRLIGVCADRDQPEFLCSRSDSESMWPQREAVNSLSPTWG